MKRMPVIKKYELNNFQAFATVIIMSFYSVLFQAVLQNGINPLGYITYVTSPLVCLFNFIPVFTAILFLFCLTGSLRTAFVAFNIPFTIFLLINEFKILFRDEPFKPDDLSLITEANNMLGNYKLQFNFKIILLTLIMIAAIIFVLCKIRNKNVSLFKRVIGIIISLAIFLPTYFFVYSNKNVYDKIDIVGNEFHESDVYANKGFLFSFLSMMRGTKLMPPEGYSEEKAREILDKYEVDKNEKLPNIIAIMSESFFDAQVAKKIEFLPGMNPYEKLNKIKSESTHGKIFVPGFAGGTAQSEFEFLCGFNISLTDSSLPTMYKTHITRPTYGLVSELKSRNFTTDAIHPGYPWFYNRQNVYKLLGFDSFTTIEDLPPDAEKKNYYISDKVTSKLICDSYAKHLKNDPDKGYFGFTVTIQNHGPYSQNNSNLPARLVRPDGLDDSEYNILENYMNNVYDAVELLDDVIEYTEALEVPTVVVFFGDHLPSFDSENMDYEAIGYDIKGDSPESIISQHTTPFIIHGNSAFKSSFPEYKNSDDKLISSNFLTAELLKYIRVDLSPFFKFTKELSEEVSVIYGDFHIENEGPLSQNISEKNKEKLREYRILQYYNIKSAM